MKRPSQLPRLSLGVYPTPLHKLENISAKYGKSIWIKRDDLCGVALGGNKVRKLEFLLAEAKRQGCDVVFTTGGAQSNHAMLTAVCAARLGMRCILLLKQRGVTDRKGNLILDEIYGADVRFMDTDSYDDIYAEMHRMADELAKEGHRSCLIPCGGSNPLGSIGYAACVEELSAQATDMGLAIGHLVSATGSGGTTAGLLLGASLFLPGVKVTGMGVDDDPFAEIVPDLAQQAAALLDGTLQRHSNDFEMVYNLGDGYAIPNPKDTPYMEELARTEGILLDPVYTGKAWSGMLQQLRRELCPELTYAEIAQLAEAADAYPGRVNADDQRFMAPASMRDEIAAALREGGYPLPASVGEWAACICHSLADCYARAVDALEKLTDTQINCLRVVGGGCPNAYLNRLTAQALHRRVTAGPVEATAIGNILSQMGLTLSEARALVRQSFPLKEY